MNNRDLSELIDRVKIDLPYIINKLVEEVEKLEDDKVKMKDEIDSLNARIEDIINL